MYAFAPIRNPIATWNRSRHAVAELERCASLISPNSTRRRSAGLFSTAVDEAARGPAVQFTVTLLPWIRQQLAAVIPNNERARRARSFPSAARRVVRSPRVSTTKVHANSLLSQTSCWISQLQVVGDPGQKRHCELRAVHVRSPVLAARPHPSVANGIGLRLQRPIRKRVLRQQEFRQPRTDVQLHAECLRKRRTAPCR